MDNISVHVATWNVNSKLPSKEGELKDLIVRNSPSPQIVVLGMQELEQSDDFSTSTKELDWKPLISKTLGSDYVELQSVRLDGLLLLIFVKNQIHNIVSNLSSTRFGLYSKNDYGHKGVVAARFDVDTFGSFCFVNCHLMPHNENWEERDAEWNKIWNELKFDDEQRIKDHDHIFMFGDLNYRVDDTKLDIDTEKTLLAEDKVAQVFEQDQLRKSIAKGAIFPGFVEGPIQFKPTFKYDAGTDNWDSKSNRAPAWCDRILYKGKNGTMKQLEYISHPQYTISDHKPVTAHYLFSK